MKRAYRQKNTCGHPNRKHRARGMCASCYQQWFVSQPKHRERSRIGMKARNHAYYLRNKEEVWERQLIRLYGMNASQYYALLAKQNGRCALCGSITPRAKGNKFHVDHDHETGKIRGLLCSPCNVMLGSYEKMCFNPRLRAYLAGSGVVIQRATDSQMHKQEKTVFSETSASENPDTLVN